MGWGKSLPGGQPFEVPMTMMRRSIPALLILPLVLSAWAVTLADASRYAVKAKEGPAAEGAPTEYEAQNPAHELKFAFPATGMIGKPEHAGANPWSVELNLAGT